MGAGGRDNRSQASRLSSGGTHVVAHSATATSWTGSQYTIRAAVAMNVSSTSLTSAMLTPGPASYSPRWAT